MKLFCLWSAVVVASVQSLMAAQGEPGGPGEYKDCKVLKAYTAKDGDYIFHAFAIEWEGQEVIAEDVGALISARSDRAINVLVSRGLPRGENPRGTILFLARPEKRPPGETMPRRDIAERIAGMQGAAVQLKVQKVYALPDGDYAFRAYEVEWQGQDVVVRDSSANTKYEVGDAITVGVYKNPHLDGTRSYGTLSFVLMSQRIPARAKRR